MQGVVDAGQETSFTFTAKQRKIVLGCYGLTLIEMKLSYMPNRWLVLVQKKQKVSSEFILHV